MQALTNRAKQVDRKPMTALERIYLWNILKGMAITFRHIFKKKATINYPEQKRSFSPVFRGLQILNRDEEGRERCTACGLCAVACPAEAITMEAAERCQLKNIYTAKKNMQPNMRSICCVAFSVDCVKKLVRKMRSILSQTFAPANYAREGFIYKKEDLLIPHPKEDPEAYAKALGERKKINN